MRGYIRQCPIDKIYTLFEVCPKCGHVTVCVHPARYSPVDAFGKYRRLVRKDGSG